MSNKYCNLEGTNKIKDEYPKINNGFDKVETDVNAVNGRVDNIVNNPDPNKDLELVDLRNSNIYGVFPTAKARSDNIDNLFSSHLADYATHKADYATHKADYATHLADNVTDSDGAHGLKVESGTFTPTIIGFTTTGDNTYSSNYGYYEKIGRTVIFHIFIVMTAKDPAMEGSVYIAGLPFVAYAQAGRYNSVSIGSYTNIVTAGKQLGGVLQDNKATIGIYLSGDNMGASFLSASGINNNTSIRLSGIYQTA